MAGYIPFTKADAWLRATRSVWLATTRPDGRPHATPVWFVWDGRAIYFCTAPGTQKHRNLQRQRSVVAHLGDGDDVLFLEGRATVVDDGPEIAAVDGLFRRKYVDPHSGATAGYPESAGDVPYRIDVERITIWEYGVVGTRSDFRAGESGEWTPMPPC